ncbi:MAG: hypothetical protein IRY99_21725, partial [Isosphaeraceae bacterium]|nr:hypothetical protein [Isosphaeraceae bacterium]
MRARIAAVLAGVGLLAMAPGLRAEDFGKFLERAARDALGEALGTRPAPPGPSAPPGPGPMTPPL